MPLMETQRVRGCRVKSPSGTLPGKTSDKLKKGSVCHPESSDRILDPGAGILVYLLQGYTGVWCKKSGWDFTQGKQATNSKKDAFTAWKVRAGLYLGKVKKGKNSPVFALIRKVPVGLYSGKQATNSKKATFTAGRVRAGLYPICGGAIWAFIRVILLYAGTGLSHGTRDGFVVIQSEI